MPSCLLRKEKAESDEVSFCSTNFSRVLKSASARREGRRLCGIGLVQRPWQGAAFPGMRLGTRPGESPEVGLAPRYRGLKRALKRAPAGPSAMSGQVRFYYSAEV